MTVLRLSLALLLVQAGFHSYTAALPLALSRAGTPDAIVGLVMGVAAIVQIPAAILGGRLVDRFGGTRLFTLGAAAYLAASTLVLLPGAEVAGAIAPFVAVRMLQGLGIALVPPSSMSLVPRLVPPARLANGLAINSAAQNLTLVLAPPISIAILDAASLRGVAIAACLAILAGVLLAQRLPLRAPDPTPASMAAASRRFGITFRRAWLVPLLIVVFYVAHWGAVTAYLPIRAEAAGADIGLYFAADGVAIFLMRLPTGWLVDRVSSRALILVGAGMTFTAIGMLLLPLTTPLLIMSGIVGGAGGGMVLTPITVVLSRRSTDADRGSAFALFSGGMATAMSLGSVGGAPIVALFGLPAALAMGMLLIGLAMALTTADGSLGSGKAGPRAGGPRPLEAAEAVDMAEAGGLS